MDIGRQVSQHFAETMLFWRGYLQAREIADFAGVSERTARNLVAEWRTRGLLPPYQSHAERRLIPVEDFDPGPCVTRPENAFFSLLVAEHLPGSPFSKVSLPGGGHDLSLSAKIPTNPTREIVAACIERVPVTLIYAAKTGIQEFVFSPSALVRSRGRYHLRGHRAAGHDALRQRLEDRYVDVVPARAVEARRTQDAHFIGLDGDDDWHKFVQRRYFLSPELSDTEKLCYEHEYGIADTGEFKITQRRALMRYVAQELWERRCWRRDGSSVQIWKVNDSID